MNKRHVNKNQWNKRHLDKSHYNRRYCKLIKHHRNKCHCRKVTYRVFIMAFSEYNHEKGL